MYGVRVQAKCRLTSAELRLRQAVGFMQVGMEAGGLSNNETPTANDYELI